MFLLNICFISFLLIIFFSMLLFMVSIYFMLYDLVYFIEYNLIEINSSCIVMIFLFDWMSLIFMSTVLFISSLVILYSNSYMLNDLNLNRFIMLVILFVLSMMLMILSPNLISILLGWDGLGLISYCLVIYYQNVKSFNAGMLTVLSNRIGDIFLLLSISWMMNFGGWNFYFYTEILKSNVYMMMITMMILLASFTKSAQIPFSSWLPAAMAAPTPVSSLVHSSTLVTAGVYLLIRFENLFNSEYFINFFLLFSSLTMFMSGLNANFEFDLKKIIALSTLSQLGLMMSILFLGFKFLAFFHLLMHAFFKALLFMCSGIYIHSLNNFQDIRILGSMFNQMPFTSICFHFSNLSLCGFPFLAGFYSKDLILEMLLMLNYNMFIMMIFFISTFLTVSYTFRLIYFSMLGWFNMISLNFLNDYDLYMNNSMYFMMLMVVFGGSMFSWLMFPYNYFILLPFYLKILPLIIIIFGMIFGFFVYYLNLKMFKLKFYFLNMFFSMMWFLPIIFSYGMIKNIMYLNKEMTLSFNQNWMEFYKSSIILIFLKNFSGILELFLFYFNNILNLFLILFILLMYYLFIV
uniref:NADH-ubiquinone oxidoreductase chain 5 n=1 Tax=Nesodiprion zhejiangensis TaxID=2916818 RepID=A0A9E8AFI0_9HYME|nr:NADH dehydrogenase subunit 5 [Nesodiprion zhejiangensis]UZC33515.1 NADH dehydrogenase subunit 5 [Nesodiprion zhejiangensis]